MGIDNDYKLFVGNYIECDYEKWDRILKDAGVESEEWDIIEKLSLLLKERFDVTLDYASPYFDCDQDERYYFIEINVDIIGKSIPEIIGNLQLIDLDKYRYALTFLEEDYVAPTLEGCAHVY
jgi:hypothetical protein